MPHPVVVFCLSVSQILNKRRDKVLFSADCGPPSLTQLFVDSFRSPCHVGSDAGGGDVRLVHLVKKSDLLCLLFSTEKT